MQYEWITINYSYISFQCSSDDTLERHETLYDRVKSKQRKNIVPREGVYERWLRHKHKHKEKQGGGDCGSFLSVWICQAQQSPCLISHVDQFPHIKDAVATVTHQSQDDTDDQELADIEVVICECGNPACTLHAENRCARDRNPDVKLSCICCKHAEGVSGARQMKSVTNIDKSTKMAPHKDTDKHFDCIHMSCHVCQQLNGSIHKMKKNPEINGHNQKSTTKISVSVPAGMSKRQLAKSLLKTPVVTLERLPANYKHLVPQWSMNSDCSPKTYASHIHHQPNLDGCISCSENHSSSNVYQTFESRTYAKKVTLLVRKPLKAHRQRILQKKKQHSQPIGRRKSLSEEETDSDEYTQHTNMFTKHSKKQQQKVHIVSNKVNNIVNSKEREDKEEKNIQMITQSDKDNEQTSLVIDDKIMGMSLLLNMDTMMKNKSPSNSPKHKVEEKKPALPNHKQDIKRFLDMNRAKNMLSPKISRSSVKKKKTSDAAPALPDSMTGKNSVEFKQELISYQQKSETIQAKPETKKCVFDTLVAKSKLGFSVKPNLSSTNTASSYKQDKVVLTADNSGQSPDNMAVNVDVGSVKTVLNMVSDGVINSVHSEAVTCRTTDKIEHGKKRCHVDINTHENAEHDISKQLGETQIDTSEEDPHSIIDPQVQTHEAILSISPSETSYDLDMTQTDTEESQEPPKLISEPLNILHIPEGSSMTIQVLQDTKQAVQSIMDQLDLMPSASTNKHDLQTSELDIMQHSNVYTNTRRQNCSKVDVSNTNREKDYHMEEANPCIVKDSSVVSVRKKADFDEGSFIGIPVPSQATVSAASRLQSLGDSCDEGCLVIDENVLTCNSNNSQVGENVLTCNSNNSQVVDENSLTSDSNNSQSGMQYSNMANKNSNSQTMSAKNIDVITDKTTPGDNENCSVSVTSSGNDNGTSSIPKLIIKRMSSQPCCKLGDFFTSQMQQVSKVMDAVQAGESKHPSEPIDNRASPIADKCHHQDDQLQTPTKDTSAFDFNDDDAALTRVIHHVKRQVGHRHVQHISTDPVRSGHTNPVNHKATVVTAKSKSTKCPPIARKSKSPAVSCVSGTRRTCQSPAAASQSQKHKKSRQVLKDFQTRSKTKAAKQSRNRCRGFAESSTAAFDSLGEEEPLDATEDDPTIMSYTTHTTTTNTKKSQPSRTQTVGKSSRISQSPQTHKFRGRRKNNTSATKHPLGSESRPNNTTPPHTHKSKKRRRKITSATKHSLGSESHSNITTTAGKYMLFVISHRTRLDQSS